MNRSFYKTFLCVGALLLCITEHSTFASDYRVSVAQKEPPKEVNEAIGKTLQPATVQLHSGGKLAFEIWLRTEVPLQSAPESPAKALDAIKQSTLLGVIAIPSDKRDYKDSELPAGVYTLRFGLQPQDGNHLGTAEFSYFAVLVGAKKDAQIDGITDYKSLVKASKDGTPSDHPVILSLRPASSADGVAPKLSEPATEHKSVLLRIPARVAGSIETSSLSFELVFEGKGKT